MNSALLRCCTILLLGTVAATVAACSNTPSATTTSSSPGNSGTGQTPSSSSPTGTPNSGSQSLPAVGTYTDGPTGSPHYKLNLTTSSGNTLSGSIIFVYQDGSTSSAMNFTGSASNGHANLTMASGTQFTATYTQDTILLASCTSFLQYAHTASQCTFSMASGA